MRLAAPVLASVIVVGLVACTPAGSPPPASDPASDSSQQPTGLSSEQAEQLAVTRFRNFDAGIRAIHLSIPSTQVGAVDLTGWFDFEQHIGYGLVKDGGTLWWSESTVAVRDVPASEASIPLPTDGWVSYPLDPGSNPLATALTLVGSLGSDRPENPQLLAQSDALWVRSDTIGGAAVGVFIGPSADDATVSTDGSERARYWVDDRGLLLRFEAPVGAEWMTLDLSTGSADIPITTPGAP
ncbi:hypothetical protein IWX81_002062 [Salinibacterium sp. CAN_S4]|uniref:hypothetical protein n=1 Tax=Salinibacterium sp. CAN_S4 TaxID=2787727 RepID=UPI0018EFFE09